MEPGAEIPAAAVDEKAIGCRDRVHAQEGHPDRAAPGRRPRAAGDRPDVATARGHAIPVYGREVALDLEPEQLSSDLADVGPSGDDLLTDVASLGETDRGFRSPFEGERVFPHVDPEPRDARLDPEDVPGIAPFRSYSRTGKAILQLGLA